VKTLQPVVCAQQKNRTCGLGESFMRERHSARINLAPERLVDGFSHSLGPLLPNRNARFVGEFEEQGGRSSCIVVGQFMTLAV
jgi:hypothetical protein